MGILRTSFLSFIVVLFTLVFTESIYAQLELPEDKVSWSFSIEQNGDEATVTGKITMVKDWHIYGAYLPKGSFSIPTKVELVPSSNFQLVGKLIEPKPVLHHDDILDEDLFYHSNTIYLKQKIKITSEKDFVLKGKFSFQTCDDEKCLPPHEADFTVKVKGVKKEQSEIETTDFKTINGDEAIDKDGNKFVYVKGEWHKVPEGNSVTFYKKYLNIKLN